MGWSCEVYLLGFVRSHVSHVRDALHLCHAWTRETLSSAVPKLWFSSSGGVCVCVRVCREPLYL